MEDWNCETIFYGHYRSTWNHWYNRPENPSNLVKKKCKIIAITGFKVIEVSTNQKPLCDFLLVINSNWHPISYRFGVIAAYCFNFGHFAFLSPPLGGLGTTYDADLWLIEKCVVDFLLVLIGFFAKCYDWVATSEKRSKIGDFAPTRSVWSKISGRSGRRPPIIFARIVRPMNTLQLCRWQFSHKETL